MSGKRGALDEAAGAEDESIINIVPAVGKKDNNNNDDVAIPSSANEEEESSTTPPSSKKQKTEDRSATATATAEAEAEGDESKEGTASSSSATCSKPKQQQEQPKPRQQKKRLPNLMESLAKYNMPQKSGGGIGGGGKEGDVNNDGEDELKLDDDDNGGAGEAGATTTTESTKPLIIKSCNVIIFGLKPGLSHSKLTKFLQQYGGPIKCLNIKSAFASFYCQCEFDSIASAQNAYDKLNGRKMHGKTLMIKPL